MKEQESQQMIDVLSFWHTVTDTNSQLHEWAKHLSDQDYLELGQDTRLLQYMESDLSKITRQIRNLNHFFDLKKVTLNDANKYYELLRQLDMTLQFVRTVRKQAFGTISNTQECVDKLNLCVEGISQMSKVFPFAPPTIKH